MQKGTIAAASAYVLWGLLPLFWHALHTVPALEILAHRMVWSLLVVLALLAARRDWRWLGAVWHDRRVVVTFAVSALLLTLNWWVYIWAVNAGHVIETSLGYFINPLVNVLLGVLVLHEHLRTGQRIAITLALAGVLYLTISYGQVPWIALALAGTFGLYGLIRKQAPLGSLEGLTLETLLLFLPALAYLLVLEAQGRGAFGHQGVLTTLLLASAGIATATPLLLFAAGAPDHTRLAGAAAVPGADAAVAAGCARLPRTAQRYAPGRLQPDLAGAGDLHCRRGPGWGAPHAAERRASQIVRP